MHSLGLRSLPLLTSALLLSAGCSDTTPAITSATDGTESDSDTGTTTGSETASASGTTTATTTATGTASASGTGMACIPGMSIACACPEGEAGAQVCDPDGMSYGPCVCTGASSGPTATDPTTTDPTTTDPTETDSTTTDPTDSTTTDSTTTGTTGMNSACDEVVEIEMMPDEATLTGGWGLAMSMMGEGQIAFIQNPNMGGSILYEPELPCDDTWYIWARALDNGQDDSYFATLDGEPEPPAIFEGDCDGGGNGYVWARLNWRDIDANACEYVEDPWAPTWDAGVHAIEFSYRESQAMGRIVITNDPDFTP